MVATLVIAALAFVLSYSKLADLAQRAGYTASMAHLWPLIVDGLAVVATVGVLRLHTGRWYAWMLLCASTAVSVVAAVASAVFPAGSLPPVPAALVSVVPPLCLLVAPHLAVLMWRDSAGVAGRTVAGVEGCTPVESRTVAAAEMDHPVAPGEGSAGTDTDRNPVAPVAANPGESELVAPVAAVPDNSVAVGDVAPLTPVADEPGVANVPGNPVTPAAVDRGGADVAPATIADVKTNTTDISCKQDELTYVGSATLFAVPPDKRAQALRLIDAGWSQRAVARRMGVSDTTIRRWIRRAS
ncbi:DUF2637 domain-containing protein [Rhodococcus rhodochrous]|uniref:DUF2637 domain-containing protein n=1 Tax=Rhodococcus rhodochrous TaxID=1829 RepID=UPI0027DF5E6F|nr:DUF2637 domain-containing protein [Rhodococcus rhodochrous]